MTDHEMHLLMDASHTMQRCEWPDRDTRQEAVRLSNRLNELIANEINHPPADAESAELPY